MERRFKVTVNGRAFDVTVEDLSSTPSSILPQPGDMKVPAPEPLPSEPAAPRAAGDLDPADLPSPLAGVVAEIGVTEGDRVEVGQKVAAIEAMKMRTSVVAHRPGRVLAVNVKEGDAVEAAQPLMRIE